MERTHCWPPCSNHFCRTQQTTPRLWTPGSPRFSIPAAGLCWLPSDARCQMSECQMSASDAAERRRQKKRRRNAQENFRKRNFRTFVHRSASQPISRKLNVSKLSENVVFFQSSHLSGRTHCVSEIRERTLLSAQEVCLQ